MRRVWQGLERDASHLVSEKTPLGVDSVLEILKQGARVGKATFPEGAEEKMVGKADLLKIRTAAAVAVAFFGTRRQAEVASLRLGNCTRDSSTGGWNVWVESQKNDQAGLGQMCLIPPMGAWGEACPCEVINWWFRVRQGPLIKMDRENRLMDRAVSRVPGESPRDILFPAVSGKYWGLEVSAQALTNALRRAVGGKETPSARKGGTQFYLVHGMGERATQQQAGWKKPRSLEQVYGKVGGSELQTAVQSAADKAGQVWEARAFVKEVVELQFDNPRVVSNKQWGTTKSRVLKQMARVELVLSKSLVGVQGPRFVANVRDMVAAWGLKGEDKKLCARVEALVSKGESRELVSRDTAARAAAVERAAA